MYANSGRKAVSVTSECRAEPPVAPTMTGTPLSTPPAVASQNDLNKPVKLALYVGVTATTASAAPSTS